MVWLADFFVILCGPVGISMLYLSYTDLVTDGALGTFEIDRADNLSEPEVQSLQKSVEGVAID